MGDIRLSPRQRKFVNALLEGKSGQAAMLTAGYSRGTAMKNAARLQRTEGVSRALAEARARLADQVELTAEIVLARLEEARQLALVCDPPQCHAAVAAAVAQARICGLVVERSVSAVVIAKPAPHPDAPHELSPEEWKRQFAPQ
jgi:hypothetical protein